MYQLIQTRYDFDCNEGNAGIMYDNYYPPNTPQGNDLLNDGAPS